MARANRIARISRLYRNPDSPVAFRTSAPQSFRLLTDGTGVAILGGHANALVARLSRRWLSAGGAGGRRRPRARLQSPRRSFGRAAHAVRAGLVDDALSTDAPER